jgi:hypothetical protein
MAYCEKTDNNEFVLHTTADEMALVYDLVNSVDNPVAIKLRKCLDPVIRSYGKFKIHIDPKIEICNSCKGEGFIFGGNLTEAHNHHKTDCDDCGGHGRRKLVITKRYENISVVKNGRSE